MNKQIEYTDGPLGNLRAVEDFLPAPEELIFKADTTKVTLRLSVDSVDFFKASAEEHHGSYQRMIRNLLDHYVMQQRLHHRRP